MAEVEKLVGSESPLEIGQKINEIIEKGGGGGLEIGDIGIAPLGIDETQGKRRYLNGQLIIQEQYVQFTNKVKSAVALYPSLACTESEWQTTATMTVGGQVGKFVVDDEGGTIRLPKIIMPIQGLTDLSKLGEIVEAGLPNITGAFGTMWGRGSTRSGALYQYSSTTDKIGGSTSASYFTVGLDASRSSSVYKDSVKTVQQEQIQYPYFIQVATGAETEDNIINEIELNNPFSLLDYKYSEYELNNLSWLRSNGQYNSKAVYSAVYDLLLKIYNGTETKVGVSVKLSTGSYTDYDFVLNTSNETFRLPIKVRLASGKAVVGNGTTLGLMDGNSHKAGLVYASDNVMHFWSTTSGYGANVGASATSSSGRLDTGVGIGVTDDPTKSGIETSDSGLYLYFYVGETVQNANLINAGRIQEKVAECITRMDCKAYITETYQNGTSWYRVWSDGWCEQGGSGGTSTSGGSAKYTITFLKPFKDTNYNGLCCAGNSGGSGWGGISFKPVTTSTAEMSQWIEGTGKFTEISWRAYGYIA